MTLPEPLYVVAWSQETDATPSVTVRVTPDGSLRLAFRGELPHDRDHHGILWRRQTISAGRGHPLKDRVHSYRQRTAMAYLLCHADASSTLGGHALHDDPPHPEQPLFLLDTAEVHEGYVTATPPVCHQCAPHVARTRSGRKRSYTAVVVDEVRPWGVAGALYDPTTLRLHLAANRLTAVRYRSPRAPWVVAHQALISLHGITPVRLKLRNGAT
ncbi:MULTISPECIES: hypothetical protein [Streptomyces]|uniref:Uncharacterized protein n=1 Tax=Streptomyces ramulosus TaxID=47762 RepID=A0ABW1FWH6_9ACTN